MEASFEHLIYMGMNFLPPWIYGHGLEHIHSLFDDIPTQFLIRYIKVSFMNQGGIRKHVINLQRP